MLGSALGLQYTKCDINRRMRRRLYGAMAILSLALWMFVTVAEAWTPLHAWLHGGAIPENDECTLVLLSHGKIDTTPSNVPVVVQSTSFEVTPSVAISFCS